VLEIKVKLTGKAPVANTDQGLVGKIVLQGGLAYVEISYLLKSVEDRKDG